MIIYLIFLSVFIEMNFTLFLRNKILNNALELVLDCFFQKILSLNDVDLVAIVFGVKFVIPPKSITYLKD